jgi:hypothetical protein
MPIPNVLPGQRNLARLKTFIAELCTQFSYVLWMLLPSMNHKFLTLGKAGRWRYFGIEAHSTRGAAALKARRNLAAQHKPLGAVLNKCTHPILACALPAAVAAF